MDPYEAMLGMDEQDPEALRAVARALRGQAGAGGRLSTSSIPQVADQGMLMQKLAQAGGEGVGLQQYRARSDATRRRGDDLSADAANSRTRTMRDIDEGERGIAKISNDYLKGLEEEAKQFSTTQSIIRGFKPEYASKMGFRMAGKLGREVGQNWPILAEGMDMLANATGNGLEGSRLKDAADWHGNFEKYYSNPVRHELFGSALTEPERKLWEASNIHEGMTVDQLKSRLQMMSLIDQKAIAHKVMQLRASKVPAAIIQANYGGLIPDEAFADPAAYKDQMTEAIVTFRDKNQTAYMSDEDLEAIANGE